MSTEHNVVKVVAVLPWSCGGHMATYHELNQDLDREDMLRSAWGKAIGSQYVSRIYRTVGDDEVELWNERDGWKEEPPAKEKPVQIEVGDLVEVREATEAYGNVFFVGPEPWTARVVELYKPDATEILVEPDPPLPLSKTMHKRMALGRHDNVRLVKKREAAAFCKHGRPLDCPHGRASCCEHCVFVPPGVRDLTGLDLIAGSSAP